MINFNFIVLNDYLSILILMLFGVVVASFLIFSSYFLVLQIPDSEKLSTYECGYEAYDSTRHVFNIHFCLIAIFFIIFDIELLFIIPWCLAVSDLSLLSFWSTIDFWFELVLGYFYIYYSNSLNWE